jgi:DNA-directed RNA polymerase specialized sigma24 family protein
MKIPKGMSESEVLEVINRIADRYAYKFRFGYFEAEDIRQEAFLIAYTGLAHYDKSRSLENFLYIHLSNRLKNFKRDNYYRYEVGDAQRMQNTKKSILEPIDIHELFHIATGSDIEDEAHISEIHDLIDEKLPANMRSDYLKLKNKGKLTKSRKNKIIKKLQEIIDGEIQDEEG